MAIQLLKYGEFSVPYEMIACQNQSTIHNKSINKSRPAGCSVAEWTLFANAYAYNDETYQEREQTTHDNSNIQR
jgi:hypothetical protein